MDRRHALKKIGAGTAVVAASPMIVSKTAFAYDTPTPPTNNPIFAVNRDTATAAFVGVVVPPSAGTCPLSSTNTPDGGGSFDIAAVTYVLRSRVTRTSDGSFFDFSQTGIGSSLAINTGPGGPDWDGTGTPGVEVDTVQVELDATYTCTYSDGTTRAVCKRWNATWHAQGGDGNSATFSQSIAPSGTIGCP